MGSKIKMNWAIHPEDGKVSAFDVELDESLKYSLTCEYCNVPLTFVRTFIKNDKYVAAYFRLKNGEIEHREIDGETCKYNKTNKKSVSIPKSKIANLVLEEDLKVRVNIPVELKKSLMDLLSEDLLQKKTSTKIPESKKAPGNYVSNGKTLTDYINSARAFSKIAKYFENNKDTNNNYLEFKSFGVTAQWKDIYFEDWDKVFEKFQTSKPKELICLRGLLSSISSPYQSEGYMWVNIRLKKTVISKNKNSTTFAAIKLFEPVFEHFLKKLKIAKEEFNETEITFYGNIQKNNPENRNIIGIAVHRSQVHFEKYIDPSKGF